MSIIADRLGEAHADALSRIAGGTQLVVPDSLTASAHNSGRLRERVGDTLFALLVFHFGGTRLYVPQLDQARRTGHEQVDARRVDRLTKRGWSAPRIARELGCSDRTIYAKRRLNRSRARTNAHKSGEGQKP